MSQRRAAVLGHPIDHSLSPVLHREAYRVLGLDWTYDAIDIEESTLPGFVAQLDDAWAGLSLTMPLKRAVIPLVDSLTPMAELVHAANTVVVTDQGLVGHNTDVPGLVSALRERGIVELERATIIGSGATAASSVAALAEIGATHVSVVARRGEPVADLARLGQQTPAGGVEVRWVPWTDAEAAFTAALVINTVPAEAASSLTSALAEEPQVLFDVIYQPWPTPLAQAWRRAGGTIHGGLDLLVHQAALQVELMTGQEAPVNAMRDAGESALAQR